MHITVKTKHQPDFQSELTNAYPQDIAYFESNQIQIEMHVANVPTYKAILIENGADGEPLETSVKAEEGVSMHDTMAKLRVQCEALIG